MSARLENLLREVRGCRVCEAYLPNPPNPVLRANALARLLIVGQAPGRRVHESGIPWNDPSGDRLREWLKVTRETFYDETRIALIPVAFCYPGTGEAGDLPPRSECAPLWHPRLRAELPAVTLTVLAGSYAQKYYLGREMKASVAETVRAYEDYLPRYFPLPHPSWHNNRWMQLNSWFEREVLPELVARAQTCLGEPLIKPRTVATAALRGELREARRCEWSNPSQGARQCRSPAKPSSLGFRR